MFDIASELHVEVTTDMITDLVNRGIVVREQAEVLLTYLRDAAEELGARQRRQEHLLGVVSILVDTLRRQDLLRETDAAVLRTTMDLLSQAGIDSKTWYLANR